MSIFSKSNTGSKAVLLPVMFSGLMLVACSNNNTTQETAESTEAGSADVAPKSTLKIATESSYKPLSYTNSDGELIGFEIDLMNALCDEMEITCDIISQEWDGLIPGLQSKKFDAIIAGMSITPERQEVVDFTDPYFHSGLIFVANKSEDISLDDDLTGLPIGAQRSTVSSQYLEDNHPEADVKLYDTQENAYLDLKSGRTIAILSDKVTAINWLNSDGGSNFEQKGDEFSTEDDAMGIAVRKDDELVSQFNTALAALKDNGKYDEISSTYFGTSSTKAAAEAQ